MLGSCLFDWAAYSDSRGKKTSNAGDSGELDFALLWQIAIVDLHLPPDYFWALTLREFSMLVHRHRIERYRISAHVCCFLFELHRDKTKDSSEVTIEDFLPGFEHLASETDEDKIAAARAEFERQRLITATSGGVDLTQGMHIQIMPPPDE